LGADCVAIGRAAIANPDWPKLATKKDFKPIRPPYTAKLLKSKKVGDNFIAYLTNWQGFVKNAALTKEAV
jgi:2,4-dienoyl-CoA reductase-like NADH-dependent reductase (Old Yellow Enzyme family)